jgi:hypothetical protein
MTEELTDADRAYFDRIARHCARPVRFVATSEQYREVVDRIADALAERAALNHTAGGRHE